MAFLDAIPFWALGAIIFVLRVVDVALGTLRTIFVIEGRARIAVALGFFEVLIWVIAIAHVVGRFDDQPLLAPFYAGGFAAGVGTGLLIERELALKLFVVRFISRLSAGEMSQALAGAGHVLATFAGEAGGTARNLIYVSAKGKQVRTALDRARRADPDLFYLVESARAWSENVHPPPHPTGWRAVFKKK